MKTLRIALASLCLLRFAGCKYLENDATAVADAKGDIFAEGVDELLYGRLSNVL